MCYLVWFIVLGIELEVKVEVEVKLEVEDALFSSSSNNMRTEGV
jgi:hypothetical protein